MLYAQLRKVLEIDSRISKLHQELANLYDERARYVGTTSSGSTSTASNNEAAAIVSATYDPWVQQQYAKLAHAWGEYDIVIPPFKELERKLQAAREILDRIRAVDQKLAKNMQLLLVPPKKILAFPVQPLLREKQPSQLKADYINPALLGQNRASSSDWRLMVVLASASGVNYGSAKQIFDQKKYMLCGYDSRGLGICEYAALTLQAKRPIDQNVWTILLKNIDFADAALIPSAKYIDKQYRFELDETGGAFGDERFRPAIEVKEPANED